MTIVGELSSPSNSSTTWQSVSQLSRFLRRNTPNREKGAPSVYERRLMRIGGYFLARSGTFHKRADPAWCNNARGDMTVHRMHIQCLPYWLACWVLRNVINTSLTHALNTARVSLPLCEPTFPLHPLFSPFQPPLAISHFVSLPLRCVPLPPVKRTHAASNECNRERENCEADGSSSGTERKNKHACRHVSRSHKPSQNNAYDDHRTLRQWRTCTCGSQLHFYSRIPTSFSLSISLYLSLSLFLSVPLSLFLVNTRVHPWNTVSRRSPKLCVERFVIAWAIKRTRDIGLPTTATLGDVQRVRRVCAPCATRKMGRTTELCAPKIIYRKYRNIRQPITAITGL